MPRNTASDSGIFPPTGFSAWKSADWVRATLVVIALFYAFFAGLRTVADFDLGWQLATGRYILQHHTIPSTDVFSYTARGNAWIYPPFSGVVFYAVFLLGGYAALSWVSALATMAAVGAIARQGSRFAAALAIVAVPVIVFRTFPRAELFTTVLFAAYTVTLWRHYQGAGVRLWILPLLMIAWVNLHTGFVAGLALIAAYLLTELCDLPFPARRIPSLARLRAAAPWLALSAVATLVNPWGWRIYEAIVRQASVSQLHSEVILEWSKVHFSSATWVEVFSWRDPASAYWWLLAAAAAAIVVSLARLEIGPALLLALAAWASLRHIRFQGVFVIFVCIVGGSVLSRAWRTIEARAAARQRRATLPSDMRRIYERHIADALLIVLSLTVVTVRIADLVTDRYYLASGQIVLFGTGPSWWFPEGAATFLIKQRLPGHVFGDYDLGGYLTWRLGPDYPDYVDGRFIPFGRDLFLRQIELTGLALDSPEWEQEASDRNVQTVIFSLARLGELENVPLRADCHSRGWAPVYLDDTAVIFVRGLPENRDLVARLRIQCDGVAIAQPSGISGRSWRATAERYEFLMNTAAIDYVLSRDDEAESNLSQAESIFSGDPDLHNLRAQLAVAHRQSAIAEREYWASLLAKPTDTAWYGLASLYTEQRRYESALHCLLESAAISREDYDRYRALGKLYLLMNRPQDALAAFEEARKRYPSQASSGEQRNEFDATLAEGEAAAYRQMGDMGRAVTSQLNAVGLTPNDPGRWQSLASLFQVTGNLDKAGQARKRAAALQSGPAPLPQPTPNPK